MSFLLDDFQNVLACEHNNTLLSGKYCFVFLILILLFRAILQKACMYSIITIIKILANIMLIALERVEMAKGRSLRDKKLRSAINQSRNISPYRETADKAIYSEIRSIIWFKWMRSSCQIVGKEQLSKVPNIMTNLFLNRIRQNATQ